MSQLYPSIKTEFPTTWKPFRVAVFLKGEEIPRAEYSFNNIEQAKEFVKQSPVKDVDYMVLGLLWFPTEMKDFLAE